MVWAIVLAMSFGLALKGETSASGMVMGLAGVIYELREIRDVLDKWRRGGKD